MKDTFEVKDLVNRYYYLSASADAADVSEGGYVNVSVSLSGNPSISTIGEQIMSLNKCRLKEKLGSILETEYAEKVDRAIKIQLSVQ